MQPFFIPTGEKQFVEAFKAIADPVRLQILQELWRPELECCSAEDRICACDLEEKLGISQSTVSHHMKVLIRAGLVLSSKEGRWIYYNINRYSFGALAEFITKYAGEKQENLAKVTRRSAEPTAKKTQHTSAKSSLNGRKERARPRAA